ncbi:DUF3037 domain-containing protein [Aquisalimonas lutea]|uniref:DUF3037 domain-containing protein n=1 Tax=Aquisalimonas lutea TaxID=1327750 RepID=UPI00338EA803
MKAFDPVASSKPREIGVRGQWAPIRLVPELTTGEMLNAGVVLLDEHHRVHYHVLSQFSGLECLFRNRLATQDIALVMQAVEESLPEQANSLEEIQLPSPHVYLGPSQPARDSTVDAAVNGLFQGVVTLAVHPAEAEPADTSALAACPTSRRGSGCSHVCAKKRTGSTRP